jgi:hypothetical protein
LELAKRAEQAATAGDGNYLERHKAIIVTITSAAKRSWSNRATWAINIRFMGEARRGALIAPNTLGAKRAMSFDVGPTEASQLITKSNH